MLEKIKALKEQFTAQLTESNQAIQGLHVKTEQLKGAIYALGLLTAGQEANEAQQAEPTTNVSKE